MTDATTSSNNITPIDRIQPDRSGQLRPLCATIHANSFTGVIVWADNDIAPLLGLRGTDLNGQNSLDMIHASDHRRLFAGIDDLVTSKRSAVRTRLRLIGEGSEVVWCAATLTMKPDCSDTVVAQLVDITNEMNSAEVLRQRDQLIAMLSGSISYGVLHLDAHGEAVFANERWWELTKLAPGQAVDDLGVDEAQPAHLRHRLSAAIELAYSNQTASELEIVVAALGEQPDVHLRVAVRPVNDPEGVVINATEITQDVERRVDNVDDYEYDGLTGLLNRSSITTRLGELLEDPNRSGEMSVMFCDIDRLRRVNEEEGHDAGDKLIQLAAQSILDSVRGGEYVGRVGVDQFVVVLDGVSSHVATMIAHRIDFTLRSANAWTLTRELSMSVGHVQVRPGDSVDEVMERSEQRMREVKQRHSGRFAARSA